MTVPMLALILPDYFYFVFAVCVIVSVCIILFYANRHPNPHFRPRKSDIGVVSLLLLAASFGVAFMTAGALDSDFDKEKIIKQSEDAQRMAKLMGTSMEEELGMETGEVTKPQTTTLDGTEIGGTDVPADAPEELREIIGTGG